MYSTMQQNAMQLNATMSIMYDMYSMDRTNK